MKRAKLGTIGLSLVALILPACMTAAGASSFFGRVQPPSEQVLRYNNAAEPRSIDPHKSAGLPEGNIMINIYETLATYDPKTLEPRPGVATHWQALEQARRWIFYLRKDAVWTDGHPVTAHDFVWAWQRGIDPKTANPYANLLYYVRNGEAIANGEMATEKLGIRAIDDYTLEVEMQRPTAFFVKMTPHYVFSPLPRWAIEKWGERWTDPDKIVSNGPFKFAQHKPYDHIILVKSPTYWDAANVKLEKAIFTPIEDAATVMNLYKAGELDVMQSGEIPINFIKALRVKKDYVTGTSFTIYYYSFNIKRRPFDDVRVRRAINMAIDKEAIAYNLVGRGELPATSFVPPGVAGYPQLKGPGYDPKQARQLLVEAGYPNGAGFPKTTIYYNTLDGHRQIAEAVQGMLKENLNIKIELQNEEWQTIQARRERRDFDLVRDAWTGDYLDASTFLDLFTNDTLNNHSGWIKPEYTGLMEIANAEADSAKRTELLLQAEQILINDMPIIPVYFYALNYMKKPFVDGWYRNLLDQHPLKYVSIRENWRLDSPVFSQNEMREDLVEPYTQPQEKGNGF
ncbi:MAG: peptide ABC transporter substrate-binding protein [Acidobacteriota bacterium]